MSPKAKAIAAFLISAIIGALGQVVSLGILTGDAMKYAEMVTGVLITLGTTYGVYQTPNAPA